MLDSSNVQIYRCSELKHITGTCWPPYEITIVTETEGLETNESAYMTLLETEIRGLSPTRDKPDEYGTLFITWFEDEERNWSIYYIENPDSALINQSSDCFH